MPRKRLKFTPEQRIGMPIVALILKQARGSHGETLRDFSDRLKALSGVEFSHSTIHSFENAGKLVSAKRKDQVLTISLDYIKAVAPLTPFSWTFLRDVYEGEKIRLIEDKGMNIKPLGTLIKEREEALGKTAFVSRMREYELTQEELDAAKEGRIESLKTRYGLAGFLEILPEDLALAAIAQLRDILQSRGLLDPNQQPEQPEQPEQSS